MGACLVFLKVFVSHFDFRQKWKDFKENSVHNVKNTYKSRDEYCLVIAERSLSRAPEPPLAVSKVGLAAVVILNNLF